MNRKPAIIAIAVIVIALGAAVLKWGVVDSMANGDYYTRIDNSETKELHSNGGVVDPTGGMSWEYTLKSCNEDGDVKDISFGTERVLREGAYLRLTVVPVRGVVSWEEVSFEDMPSKAQAALR